MDQDLQSIVFIGCFLCVVTEASGRNADKNATTTSSSASVHPVMIVLMQESIEPVHSIGYFVYKVGGPF